MSQTGSFFKRTRGYEKKRTSKNKSFDKLNLTVQANNKAILGIRKVDFANNGTEGLEHIFQTNESIKSAAEIKSKKSKNKTLFEIYNHRTIKGCFNSLKMRTKVRVF